MDLHKDIANYVNKNPYVFYNYAELDDEMTQEDFIDEVFLVMFEIQEFGQDIENVYDRYFLDQSPRDFDMDVVDYLFETRNGRRHYVDMLYSLVYK